VIRTYILRGQGRFKLKSTAGWSLKHMWEGKREV